MFANSFWPPLLICKVHSTFSVSHFYLLSNLIWSKQIIHEQVIFIWVLFTEILSKQSTDEQDKASKRRISFCLDSGITDKDLSRPAQTQGPVILSFQLWHCGCFHCIYLLYILIKPYLQIILNVHKSNGGGGCCCCWWWFCCFFRSFWLKLKEEVWKVYYLLWTFMVLVWKKQRKESPELTGKEEK